MLLNRLYKDIFIIISFTLFWNLIEDEYSPNMRFIEENAVLAIYPSFSNGYFELVV